MTQPFRDDPKRARALHRANKILTVVIFVAYPCLLLWLLWQKDMRLYKAICVPLDGFIIVTKSARPNHRAMNCTSKVSCTSFSLF